MTRIRPRFLSETDCHELVQRLARFTKGGGVTNVLISSSWVGNIRWGRNQISTSGEVMDNSIKVVRIINGASASVRINDTTDTALVAAARQAERLTALSTEQPNSDLFPRLPLEQSTTPNLFSDTTYQLDASKRAAAALDLTKIAREAGMLSAGYIEVAAIGRGIFDTFGRVRYFPCTQARYSVTVRDPKGTGSGWAGSDNYDWSKINASALTAIALDKCLKSGNPVAIEPGRYTTILEPQAVSDFVGSMFRSYDLERVSEFGPFFLSKFTDTEPDYDMLGQKVVDERLTISADPMDPEMGFPPFSNPIWEVGDWFKSIEVYHPATWIKDGVLVNLSYQRFQNNIATDHTLGRDARLGMPNSGAFRMSGGTTSVDEMISTTKRGLLVTRFDRLQRFDSKSELYRGYTRDGLWLIENGKISKPVKNLAFTESILFALNNIDQIGPVQRVYNPNFNFQKMASSPAIVPALKIKDFSFTGLVDAV